MGCCGVDGWRRRELPGVTRSTRGDTIRSLPRRPRSRPLEALVDKNPEADRRLLIALVLTMLVMYVWSTYISPPPMATPSQTSAAPADQAAASAAPVVTDGGTTGGAVADATPADEIVPEASASMSGPGFNAVLDSKEGALSVLTLSDYQSEATVTPLWLHVWHMSQGEAEENWTAYKGGGDSARLLTESSGFVLAGGGGVKGFVPFVMRP